MFNKTTEYIIENMFLLWVHTPVRGNSAPLIIILNIV